MNLLDHRRLNLQLALFLGLVGHVVNGQDDRIAGLEATHHAIPDALLVITGQRDRRAQRHVSGDRGVNTRRSPQEGLAIRPFEDDPNVGVGTDLVRAIVEAAVVEVAERHQVAEDCHRDAPRRQS